jgi:hypothetical protein
MILAHGTYGYPATLTTVKPDQYIIFLSRTSRYLPQSIIDDRFKEIFTHQSLIKSLIKGKLRNVPAYLKDFERRTYGPGDLCPDLTMIMRDPDWIGMGWHPLPLPWRETLKIKAGGGNGRTVKLSDYQNTGVTFIVACRATSNQSDEYRGITNVYQFPPDSYEQALVTQDEISSRILKRHRNTETLRKKILKDPLKN